jgi:thioredoxin-like negative regulator of GroEL
METFPDPRVTELKGEFVWVKVDAERNPDIAEMYELRAFPLLVFLESDGSIIKKVNRFLPAEELREEMDLILKR